MRCARGSSGYMRMSRTRSRAVRARASAALASANCARMKFAALDQTRGFIAAIRLHGVLTETMRSAVDELMPAADGLLSREQLADNPAALRWEVERVSFDAGRVFSRIAKVMFALMDRAGRCDALWLLSLRQSRLGCRFEQVCIRARSSFEAATLAVSPFMPPRVFWDNARQAKFGFPGL